MSFMIQFFRNLNPMKMIAIGGGAFLIIVLLFTYIYKASTEDMVLLYTNLDMEESGKITQELENKQVRYNLSNDGATIKVPKNEVSKLRVNLAQLGIPNKGSIIGYEIFDKEDSIGTTTFSQNIKMIRALEGEIARTISSFVQVEKVRVHLVMPQKELFSKERLEPRASIVIAFRHNKNFTKAEIDAVSNFIVTAVPGLEIKNVTIVDNKGHSLKVGSKDDSEEFAVSRNEEYKIAYENRLKSVIEALLEQSLGSGKATAQVSVEMNFDRTVINSEYYDPDSAVARSVQTIDKRESTPVNSENTDISVANNIPGGTTGESNSNLALSEENEQTTNYEISKTVKNQITETGIITKLSIGVVIDGTYTIDQNAKNVTYIPRNQEELDRITNLVKVAVGFNEERHDKIEVVNMQFLQDTHSLLIADDSNWFKEHLPNLFQTLIFAVVVLLVFVTVVRPVTLKAFEQKRGLDILATTNAPGVNDGDAINLTKNNNDPNMADSLKDDQIMKTSGSNQRINDFATFYPQETLNILRKWLDEGS